MQTIVCYEFFKFQLDSSTPTYSEGEIIVSGNSQSLSLGEIRLSIMQSQANSNVTAELSLVTAKSISSCTILTPDTALDLSSDVSIIVQMKYIIKYKIL